jgi:hypothetical protein
MDTRTLLNWFFHPWVIAGAFIFALLLLAATLAVLVYTRPARVPTGAATAVLNVIQAPTATPIPPTATALVTPSPTVPLPPAPAEGEIAVGASVQISGTGGDGLRLRTDPGLTSEVRLLGAEAEVFVVKDGPKEVDGYNWWYLEGLYDPTRRGWGVANYLAVVQNP